jgi:tetratricopeptide (TPR) repeat protein
LKILLQTVATSTDSLQKAAALEQTGAYLYDKMPEHAVYYLAKAAQLYENFNKKDKIAIAYLNIGSVYEEKLKDYQTAIAYLEKARLIWQQLENQLNEANILKYLGAVQAKAGAIAEGKNNIQKAIASFEQQQFRPGIAVSYYDLAILYKAEQKPDSSLILLDKAIELWGNASPERVFNCNNFKMAVLLEQRRWKEAKIVFKQNVQRQDRTDFHWSHRLEFYQLGQQLYTALNNPEETKFYAEKYAILQQELFQQGIQIKE